MSSDFICDPSRQEIWVEGRCWTQQHRKELYEQLQHVNSDTDRSLYQFLYQWFQDTPTMEVQTSGSTGTPKKMSVSKRRMMNSAMRTCTFLGLKRGDSLLLSMNLKYIGAQMMLVRALVAGLRVWVREPASHPLAGITEKIDFLSMVPMQLYHTLQQPEERRVLSRARVVLIGGGAVSEEVEEDLQSLPCSIYATYGMTETLSHIALRPLNGSAHSLWYTPLEGVSVSSSEDHTLVIQAPDICAEVLQTNDVVALRAGSQFRILGRKDNVVNSGGIKIQIEQDELLLKSYIPYPFVLTSVPDPVLGEALVLLCTGDPVLLEDQLSAAALKKILPHYHVPRHIYFVPEIPRTETGKIRRSVCKDMALGLWRCEKGTDKKATVR